MLGRKAVPLMLFLATLPPVQLLGDDPKHGGGSDWSGVEECLGDVLDGAKYRISICISSLRTSTSKFRKIRKCLD